MSRWSDPPVTTESSQAHHHAFPLMMSVSSNHGPKSTLLPFSCKPWHQVGTAINSHNMNRLSESVGPPRTHSFPLGTHAPLDHESTDGPSGRHCPCCVVYSILFLFFALCHKGPTLAQEVRPLHLLDIQLGRVMRSPGHGLES